MQKSIDYKKPGPIAIILDCLLSLAAMITLVRTISVGEKEEWNTSADLWVVASLITFFSTSITFGIGLRKQWLHSKKTWRELLFCYSSNSRDNDKIDSETRILHRMIS